MGLYNSSVCNYYVVMFFRYNIGGKEMKVQKGYTLQEWLKLICIIVFLLFTFSVEVYATIPNNINISEDDITDIVSTNEYLDCATLSESQSCNRWFRFVNLSGKALSCGISTSYNVSIADWNDSYSYSMYASVYDSEGTWIAEASYYNSH